MARPLLAKQVASDEDAPKTRTSVTDEKEEPYDALLHANRGEATSSATSRISPAHRTPSHARKASTVTTLSPVRRAASGAQPESAARP